MKKILALSAALPFLLFAETPSLAPNAKAEDEVSIDSLFSEMEGEDISMLDEVDDEEAKKLFQEGAGAISMGDEESLDSVFN